MGALFDTGYIIQQSDKRAGLLTGTRFGAGVKLKTVEARIGAERGIMFARGFVGWRRLGTARLKLSCMQPWGCAICCGRSDVLI